jgi:hypothetical protein
MSPGWQFPRGHGTRPDQQACISTTAKALPASEALLRAARVEAWYSLACNHRTYLLMLIRSAKVRAGYICPLACKVLVHAGMGQATWVTGSRREVGRTRARFRG